MAGGIGGLAGCLLLACASSTFAQAAPAAAPVVESATQGVGLDAFRRFGFAVKPLGGIPLGDFGDRVGASGGVGVDFTSRIGRTPIAVGWELGYLQYGKETRRAPLVAAAPEVLADVNTTNHLLHTHALVRVQPETGRVRPYAEGLLGFRYVFTRTHVSSTPTQGRGATLLGDLAPSGGAGGGVTVALFSGEQAGLHLDVGLRYLTGGDVEYLTQGAVQRHEAGVTLEPTRSAIDLLSLHAGVTVDF